MTDVVAFVMAGGRSTRMGADKALLPWGRTTLLDHAASLLHAVSGDVRVLCGPEPRYEGHGHAVVTDHAADAPADSEGAGAGPLAGLLAALRSAAGRHALILAVDLPLVTAEVLAALAAARGQGDAVVPVTARGPEPLCAVYSPSCAEAVARRLAAGERRMTSFWPDVRVRRFEAAELARFGDPDRLFLNVNAPADYAAAGEGV